MMIQHDILSQLAACLIVKERHQELEDLIKKNTSGENTSELSFYLGLSYALQGKLDEAFTEVKAVLAINPNHGLAKRLAFELLLHRASTKLKEKDWKSISSALALAVELVPDTRNARGELTRFKNVLPLTHIKEGNREKAAEIWEEELKKDPSNYRLIHNLALLYYWWAVKEEKRYSEKASHDEVQQSDSPATKPLRRKFVLEGSKLIEANNTEDRDAPKEKRNKIDRLWIKSITYWTVFTNMEEFWETWQKEREEVYGIKLEENAIRELTDALFENRFIRIFHDYIDQYKQDNNEDDSSRHEEYLDSLLFERKSARYWKEALKILREKNKINFSINGALKRYELIRTIQTAEGFTPCFGTVKDCNRVDECLWGRCCLEDRSREIFLIPGGYHYFQEFDMALEIHKLVELLHKQFESENEALGKLRIYLSPTGLGRIYFLAEDRKKPHRAIEAWEQLPKNLTTNCFPQDSIEGKYIYAFAVAQRGEEMSDKREISNALSDWSTAKTLTTEAIKINKDSSFNKMLVSLGAKIDELVVGMCERESKRFKLKEDIIGALKMLESAIKIVDRKTLKDHLAAFYSDMGSKKISEKRFADARKSFERALTYVPDYKRAREGIGTTYNNEAVAETDVDRSIELFKKAREYDSTSEVIKKNLAGALNVKGVRILDRISYSYNRLGVLTEALELFKKAHEYDPSNEVIIKNHNMVVDALKGAMGR